MDSRPKQISGLVHYTPALAHEPETRTPTGCGASPQILQHVRRLPPTDTRTALAKDVLRPQDRHNRVITNPNFVTCGHRQCIANPAWPLCWVALFR